MKIVKNIETPTVNFEKLKVGDVFLDPGESVCMKIPSVYSDFSGAETESLLEGCMDADEFYEHEVNTYDLERNMYFLLDDYVQVRPLNACMEVK